MWRFLLILAMCLPLPAQILAPILSANTSVGPIVPGFIQAVACTGAGNQCTVTMTTAANHLIVICYVDSSTNLPWSATDSNSNTYTSVTSFTEPTSTTQGGCYETFATGVLTTITINRTGSGGTIAGMAAEYSGISATTPLDQVTSGLTISSGTYSSGATSATTQAEELVIGWAVSRNSSAAWTQGAGFTSRITKATAPEYIFEDKVVSSTGAQTATASNADTGSFGGTLVGTFKGGP